MHMNRAAPPREQAIEHTVTVPRTLSIVAISQVSLFRRLILRSSTEVHNLLSSCYRKNQRNNGRTWLAAHEL